MEGGIPQGTVTLLTGSPGTGKSTIALAMLTEHMARGGAGIVVTTEASPGQVVDRSGLIGSPLKPFVGDGLWFLDCYSWRAGATAPEPNVLALRNLADLSAVSITLGERFDKVHATGRPLLVVFDTPSTLTLHAPGASILKLLELVIAKARAARGSVLLPVERDMHEPAFMATLATMCDGEIQFRLMEESEDLVRQLRVLTMRTARSSSGRWTRVQITPQGPALDAHAPAAPAVH